MVLSSQELAKAGVVNEHCELLIKNITLSCDVLCKSSTTFLNLLDEEVESSIQVCPLSVEELKLTQ
jgi:hypothetical protein